MKVGKRGQAKVLIKQELRELIEIGGTCAKNKALMAACFYLGSRISETIQMPHVCAFNGSTVLDHIQIPKNITKGKLGTRTIPTHPDLAEILESYYQESQHLLKMYRQYGDWSTMNFDSNGNYIFHGFVCLCGSFNLRKRGIIGGEQKYSCRDCGQLAYESRLQRVNQNERRDLTLKDFLGIRSSRTYGFFEPNSNEFLFPGVKGKSHLRTDSAVSICREAFQRVEIVGASSHSFRRTCLTELYRAGISLRVIQEISGHRNLATLQKYLEVDPDDLKKAVETLDY